MTNDQLEYLEGRIASKKALLLKWDTALDAAIASGTQEYTLEDGQGRQTVKKFSITQMRRDVSSLENEIFEMEARAYGYGSSINRSV